MNFIWDIILNAQENGMKKEDIFFEMAKDCSPWYEQSFSTLNQQEVCDSVVEVNPLFRFGAVFGSLFHPDHSEFPEFKAYFLDICLHFLCETDLQKGITPCDIHKKFIRDEILSLGSEEKEAFLSFSSQNQEIFLISYVNQLKIGSSLSMFRELVHQLFPKSNLYQIKDEPEQLLLYLGKEKNPMREQQVSFVLDCFLPLFYHISLFWGQHFGVITVSETMQLDKIQLF